MSDPSDSGLWSQKPWWCQPWTIILTGLIVIAASWFLMHRLWVTGAAAMVVFSWWVLFLVMAPSAYRNQSR